MKKINVAILLVTAIVLLSTNLSAQNSISKGILKSRIDEIFSLANKQKYKKITAYIVYTGDNAEKKYKATLDPDNPSDLKKAERLAKKMHAYIDISDTYELKTFSQETKENNRWINATVAFKSGSQSLDIDFIFLNLNGKILLADID